MKIGDRVKVVYEKEYSTNGSVPFKIGEIISITRNIIAVKFEAYRESFMKNEILANGWIEMYKREANKWVKVNKEDLRV